MKQDEDNMQALLWSYEIVTAEKPILNESESYEKLKRELTHYLNNLISNDYNKLLSILYRIDIAQEKAILELANNAEKETAGETLARMIIERQLEKVITRRKFRKD